MSAGLRAIALAEVRRLYRRPLAWFVLGLGELVMAIYFMLLVIRYLDHAAELGAAGVTVEVMSRYFASANLGVLLATPILTMTAIASDREAGLLRFLFSTPAGAADIVLGKLLGLFSLLGVYVALVALIPVTLFWGAAVDPGVYLANVFGLALFTVLHTCLGVFASALARQAVGAALLALALALTLWLADWASRLDAQAGALAAISTLHRLRGFAQGLVVGGDVAYFVLGAVVLAGLTILLVDADRALS